MNEERGIDLEARLRDLGRTPVRQDLAQSHMSGMAAVAADRDADVVVVDRRWRFGWRSVAAAAVVGFLAGSTSLAAAGNLPGPAQDAAHNVLAQIGFDVPRSTEGCPEGSAYRNHGEYVAEVEAAGGDVEAAAKSDCGKPNPDAKGNRGENGTGRGQGAGSGGRPPAGAPRPDADGDPCTGPPPWAGTHLPADQREAAQAEREAQCGTED